MMEITQGMTEQDWVRLLQKFTELGLKVSILHMEESQMIIKLSPPAIRQ